MSNTQSSENLRALVESALLVAIGFVLSFITIIRMPQGGSVTPLSMLPLLIIGLRHGLKWGLCGGLVYAGLQMLQGLWAPPSGTAAAWISMLMLDYVVAFTVLGLSGLFRDRRYGALIAVPVCLGLRFLSHFISGVVIWGNYLDADSWIFSLVYNGAYMGPEIIFTFIGSAILLKAAPVIFTPGLRARAAK